MSLFRLRCAIVALREDHGLQVVELGPGSLVSAKESVQSSGMVAVTCGGCSFSVFLRDLLASAERTEAVNPCSLQE